MLNNLRHYRIAGNIRGRKLSQISHFYESFVLLWLFVKLSSAKFGSMKSIGMVKVSNPRKFSPRKSYFSLVCESFLHRKFPALWYIHVCYNVLFVYVLHPLQSYPVCFRELKKLKEF